MSVEIGEPKMDELAIESHIGHVPIDEAALQKNITFCCNLYWSTLTAC